MQLHVAAAVSAAKPAFVARWIVFLESLFVWVGAPAGIRVTGGLAQQVAGRYLSGSHIRMPT